jgi:hypothetical protein
MARSEKLSSGVATSATNATSKHFLAAFWLVPGVAMHCSCSETCGREEEGRHEGVLGEEQAAGGVLGLEKEQGAGTGGEKRV